MAEKSREVLESELEALKKANLEREIAEEQRKIDEANVLVEEKRKEKEYSDIRAKVLEELGEKSKITTTTKDNTINLSRHKELSKFSEAYVEKHEISGMPYEDLIKDLCEYGKPYLKKKIEERPITWRRLQ